MFLDRGAFSKQTCPDPQILDFNPKSGPLEGGSNITVEGINLGRNFEDIANGVHVAHEQNGVTVGLISCVPFRELYVKTSKITCQVQTPNSTRALLAPISGPIIVKVQNDFSAKSKEYYSFVDPRITSIEPSKGPNSGGTRLNIWGLNMDAGSSIEAFVGSLPCQVISRDRNRAVCVTGRRGYQGEERVRVRFDNGQRVFNDYLFLFVEDPVITVVESGLTGQRGIPKGIPSGGILVSVKGTNLNSVQQPLMYVEVSGVKYNSSCVVESAVDMKCKSPKVPDAVLAHRFGEEGDPIELDYGFIMDNVMTVQGLSSKPSNPFQRFLMYPDPVYYPFAETDGIKYYKSDYLTINVSGARVRNARARRAAY